jgi:predicted transcriptional regulator
VLAKDLAPDRTNIYEIMSKPAISVHPDMDIRYCARLFGRFRLSRAPVMLDRKIVGIISLTDMVLKGLRDQ